MRLIAIGYTSSQALSLYGVAMGMTMPLLFVPTTIIGSLSTALVPDISTAVVQNNQTHIERRINFSLVFAMAVSAMFVPVFLGMGEILGVFLFDNVLSGFLLQSSAWILLPLGLTNMSSSLLNSLGLENKSFYSFLLGAIVMFACIWLMTPLMGINALVLAMGLNYVVAFLMNYRLLKKHAKVNLKIGKMFLKFICVIVPSGALTAFIVSLSEYIFPTFVILVVGSIVSFGSFILLSMTFNLIDIKTIYFAIKQKINTKIKKKVKKHNF